MRKHALPHADEVSEFSVFYLFKVLLTYSKENMLSFYLLKPHSG